MEYQEDETIINSSAVHWLRLELGVLHGGSSCQKAVKDTVTLRHLAHAKHNFFCMRRRQLTWEIGPYFMYFPPHLAFPSRHRPFCAQLQVPIDENAYLPTI